MKTSRKKPFFTKFRAEDRRSVEGLKHAQRLSRNLVKEKHERIQVS
jgi:hypothetical protein